MIIIREVAAKGMGYTSEIGDFGYPDDRAVTGRYTFYDGESTRCWKIFFEYDDRFKDHNRLVAEMLAQGVPSQVTLAYSQLVLCTQKIPARTPRPSRGSPFSMPRKSPVKPLVKTPAKPKTGEKSRGHLVKPLKGMFKSLGEFTQAFTEGFTNG